MVRRASPVPHRPLHLNWNGPDLLQHIEQIKFCRKILEQEPLKKYLVGTELVPGPEVQTDEQIGGSCAPPSRA